MNFVKKYMHTSDRNRPNIFYIGGWGSERIGDFVVSGALTVGMFNFISQ